MGSIVIVSKYSHERSFGGIETLVKIFTARLKKQGLSPSVVNFCDPSDKNLLRPVFFFIKAVLYFSFINRQSRLVVNNPFFLGELFVFFLILFKRKRTYVFQHAIPDSEMLRRIYGYWFNFRSQFTRPIFSNSSYRNFVHKQFLSSENAIVLNPRAIIWGDAWNAAMACKTVISKRAGILVLSRARGYKTLHVVEEVARLLPSLVFYVTVEQSDLSRRLPNLKALGTVEEPEKIRLLKKSLCFIPTISYP